VTISPELTQRTAAAPVNLRDVRGLRTEDGRIVRRAVLYRSEVPLAGALRSPDVAAWPPRTVIDLRAPAEYLDPHPLSAVAAVHAIPLGASLAPALAAAQTAALDLSVAYRHLVHDAAGRIAGIAALVATGPGPVLVHCTAGKDRTGIVIAVLLRAIGVRRDDVLADYLRTEPNLPRLWTSLRAAGVPEPHNRALLGVQADALQAVLDDIEATPGGAAGWLVEHGVHPELLAPLRERLLSPVPAPRSR
jgi:protein-tyrosine phosphatase